MSHVVFAQQSRPDIDVARIAENARRHFGAEIERAPGPEAQAEGPAGGGRDRARLRLVDPKRAANGTFLLRARLARPEDWAAARSAEARGHAAGMADLAARCPALIEVEPEPGASEVATWVLCAALAIAGLGPVMPADGSTLFGVRGALARADRASGGRTLAR